MYVLQVSRTFSDLLRTRIFTRPMGGGPRTFPGGINKWQWKRLHEKRAREKEKRLLQQEKELYQARIRSQIRANLAGTLDTDSNRDPNTSSHSPMSPNDHIKALADRFIKEGAEDLWNENDGPLNSPSPKGNERPGSSRPHHRRRSINSPIDLRKLIPEGPNQYPDRGNVSSGYNYTKSRDYSVQRGSDFRSKSDKVKPFGRNFAPKQGKFSRNESSSSDDDEFVFVSEDEGVSGRKAALSQCDKKITKRVKDVEKEMSEEVELIRHELRKKKLVGNDVEESKRGEEKPSLSQKRFDECCISPLTVKALTASGYVQMNRIQESTLSVCLEGKDALVKAKTGTGKSAAFLLPAIESVLKATTGKAKLRVNPIYVLILCPAGELASRIAAEATVLLKYHNHIGVQTLVGGTRFKDDKKRLESDPCQIIVATPGRLLDHIDNKSGLSVRWRELKMLILDEADYLIDLGFREDIEKIVACLPRQRQSLLFSATIPKEVRRMSQLVLKRENSFIDTVGLGGFVETAVEVKQSFLVFPHELHFQVVHQLLKEHILQTPDYKVIVFCTTEMVTSLMHLLLREMNMNVREMHSRKPQLYQARVSDEFRESNRLILVTSDVSAHAMDYPDVTLVIQVGIPYDLEQYIHRLGRAGREDKSGQGILLLAPWEEYFLDELKDLPLDKFPVPRIDPETKLKTENSMSKIDRSVKEAAYHDWLDYYNSIREIGRDKTTLIELANRFCESIGLKKPPPLFRKTALKMGLKDVPGVRIQN